MTTIAEGKMIVTRINVPIPPMKGEAIVKEPEPPKDGQTEKRP